MGVRFEVDIKSCAASFVTCRFESENFRMFHAAVGVGSGTNDVAASVGNHRADVGIGRGQPDALAREFQRTVKKLFVDGVSGHAGRIYHGGEDRLYQSRVGEACTPALDIATK